MNKSYLTLIIIVLVLLVAIFTNPDLERHKEILKSEIHAYMQKEIKNNTSEMPEQALGALLGGALIDRMVDSIVSTDNYLVFSTSKITWEGQSRIVGFGVFGNVFITGKVKDALTQASAAD